MTSTPEPKLCPICGRLIEWRKKWERDWASLRYCSDRCRRRTLDDVDAALERAIMDLLRARGAGKTICPSEAARAVGGEDAWRPLMERAREAARRLSNARKVVITQKGREVDPSSAKGPIRVRRR